jgi:transcriptional regulator with XRE-family HTH domain
MLSTKNQQFLSQGERLKYALDACGLSQADAAALVSVSAGQISKWVKNQNALTPMAALAFEYRTGFRSEWLLTGDGEMMVDTPPMPEDLKELAALWPRLTERERQYVLGVAQGMLAAKERE